MNLWAGGRDRARTDMLTTATEICGTENDMARNALVAQVIESFFDVLAADERRVAAERLVETARRRRDEEATRFAQGAALGADLAEVEARLAEAEAGVVHIGAARARSLAALAIALGLPAASELTLEDEGDPDPSLPADYDSALAQALESRPELERARLMARRFELGVEMAKADYRPRLDTYWSLGLYSDGDPVPEISREQKVWYANLVFSWPIFDGGARAARLAKARVELDEFREVDRQTTLAVELDVRSAYLRLDETRAELRAAERRLAAASAQREVSAARREAGAVTLAAALEGEQLLTDAAMARTNAAFGLRKAAADAARALGLFVNAGGPRAPCCGPAPEQP